MRKFKKILIANRGEIAVRIIRACSEMEIPAVAVYSDADQAALHVQLADEAVYIGGAAPSESYLNIERLIESARSTGADAIHPGYGFLAENAEFSRACEMSGIVFIGPTSKSQALLGDKLASRRTMGGGGIPIIPGMNSAGDSAAAVKAFASEIGYPVMLKASAGGGGKGMRIVSKEEELTEAFEACRREADKAFGNNAVYVEKYIVNPRHIEFQVLADTYGNSVHLFERECSIQRRHQKIIEETPSTAITPELRKRMGESALAAVRQSDYVNAGTVEFLLDEDENYYFLEVNARIQVEHPITELVCGVDLVKWQIRIAAEEKLTLSQENLHQHGHAIECRIYAEDAENNFLPSAGIIQALNLPTGPGIRVDSGIIQGSTVPVYYDPILAKLISWGENRESSIQRAVAALRDFKLIGVRTAVSYMRDILMHPNFKSGDYNTNFIADKMAGWIPDYPEKDIAFAAIVAAIIQNSNEGDGGKSVAEPENLWASLGSRHI